MTGGVQALVGRAAAGGGGGGLPLLRTYTTGAAATETAPANAANVVIEVWGSGGAGAPKTGSACTLQAGADGGASGYSRTSVAITAGQTLVYTVGQPSAAASSVSSGTKTITTMTVNGGANAVNPNGGAGGTAVGGTAVNTTGTTGQPQPGGINTPAPVGVNTNLAGANGAGGKGTLTVSGTPGAVGMVAFYYT